MPTFFAFTQCQLNIIVKFVIRKAEIFIAIAANDIFACFALETFAAFAWNFLFLAKNAKIKTRKERKEMNNEY